MKHDDGDGGEHGGGAKHDPKVTPPGGSPELPPHAPGTSALRPSRESPPVPHVPAPRRFSLRDKAPELAVEAASVLLAVLLALGVDSWQERRREERRAQNARESILAEIATNREQVSTAVAESDSLRRNIALVMARIAASDSGTVDLGFELPILSTAAWTTAQTTGAVQPLSFDWLLRVAQIYETQAVYTRTSTELLDRFGDAITRLESGEGPGALTGMRSWLNIGTNVATSLLAAYDSLLADEGRRPAPAPIPALERVDTLTLDTLPPVDTLSARG